MRKAERPKRPARRTAARPARKTPAARTTAKPVRKNAVPRSAESRVAALERQLAQAVERQTAVSEILRVMSSSPDSLDPVFRAIATSAARFCGAEDASVMLVSGGRATSVAHHGPMDDGAPTGVDLTRTSVTGTALLGRRTVHVEDVTATDAFPESKAIGQRDGQRTVLATPLLRSEEAIGAILLRRQEARRFSRDQVELLETFASQAVIAIENVRLFNETKEALERQTAISEILRVISSSPTDVQPVLNTIAESAARYCGADDAAVAIVQADGSFLLTATHGGVVEPATVYDASFRSVTSKAIEQRRVYNVADMEALPDAEFADGKEYAREHGYRGFLAAPLLKDGRPIGAIHLRRARVGAFGPQEVELVQTFAAQAVIALENVRLFNETKEALERQTAVADVLKTISQTTFDLQAVFDVVVERSRELCRGDFGYLFRRDGGVFRLVASSGGKPEHIAYERDHPTPIGPSTLLGRVALTGALVHIPDAFTEPGYDWPPNVEAGLHTIAAVPIRSGGAVVGAIGAGRFRVEPFSPEELRLFETFADQAAIAIENVRLFNETKDALDRQTATSEVLNVISRSPNDIGPVLDAVVRIATRLCEADSALAWRREEDRLVVAAYHGIEEHEIQRIGTSARLSDLGRREHMLGRLIRTGSTVHVPDVRADPAAEGPSFRDASGQLLYGTVLGVPILRQGDLIGAISIRRNTARPFSERQIDLVRTFADQAAIAIENVRLFNETKEALQRQTATAEVMKTINASVGEVQRVLDQVITQATRLADAENGFVYQVDGDVLRMTAAFGGKAEVMREWQRGNPIRKDNVGTSTGRAFSQCRTVHIPDVFADPTYTYREAQELGGFRVLLSVPMIRDGRPLGVLALWRTEPRPFTDAQIKIVELFADQALVAIENARLFNETRESLEQQTAVAEILKTISRSAFDVDKVLETLVHQAGRLSDADFAWMRSVADGGSMALPEYGSGARYARSEELAARFPPYYKMRAPNPDPTVAQQPQRMSIIGRPFYERRTLHIPDIQADAEALESSPTARRVGARTVLGVPLLREAAALGVMVAARVEVRPFSDREIKLVETFADQAAIAIANVRLFNEIQQKSHQLEVASRHKSEFLANMSHELRTPLNAIIGFTDVMLQEMFGPLNAKQKEYLEDVRGSGTHLLTLINDILDLSKIEAGRVDLELSGFSLSEVIENALTLVRERAARHGITLAADISPEVGTVSADERKIKQIVVNLLTNAVKFTPDGGRVGITASCDGSHVHVAVRDTGIGIAPEDQERVFEEFQQVGKDPERSREGTGLGLTLSKRFVELHGGRIWVESEVGKGSTFTFAIPVRQTGTAPVGA